ncbi:MAG: hypothetical protein EPO40_05905 [Myxococcaceae bacterium]|nr:MAG: hypothetical protein EPO40_05905 [Myxococcaceae bacterium]
MSVPPTTSAAPRADGLYLHNDGDTTRWLRFYSDHVLTWVSTSPGPAAQVAQWLRREDPVRSSVPWSLTDGVVAFHLAYTSLDWVPVGPTSASRRAVDHEADYAGPLDAEALSLVRREPGVAERVERYWFHPVAAEDFDGPRRPFPRIKSFATLLAAGLSAESVARVKKAPGLRRDDLYVLSAREIAARAGIPEREAAALVRWRDGR